MDSPYYTPDEPAPVTAPQTSVAQPINPPSADPYPGITGLGFDFRSDYDRLSPIRRFQLYLHGLDMAKANEANEFARLKDRQAMDAISEDQVSVHQHNAYLGEMLGNLTKQLGINTPQYPKPRQDLATMIGEGVAGLFGGGFGLGQALNAGNQVTERNQAIQYQNNVAREKTRQNVLGSEIEQTQQQLTQGQHQEQALAGEKFDLQSQSAAQANSFAEKQMQLEAEETHWKEQAAKDDATELDRHKAQVANDTRGVYGDILRTYSGMGGLTAEQRAKADADVDEQNEAREAVGLQKLPYLAKGATMTKQRMVQAATQWQAKFNQHAQEFDTTLKQKQDAAKATADWRKKILAVHWSNAMNSKQRTEIERERLTFNKKQEEGYQKLQREAEGAQGEVESLEKIVSDPNAEPELQIEAQKRLADAKEKVGKMQAEVKSYGEQIEKDKKDMGIDKIQQREADRAAVKRKIMEAQARGDTKAAGKWVQFFRDTYGQRP